MGFYKKGILGKFQGMVGTVVGSTWKGKEIMKSRPHRTSRKVSEVQLIQRAKFALVMQFLSPISGLLQLTFRDPSDKITDMNNAFRGLYREAVTGVYPALSFNYSKVLVSKGHLLNAINPVVTAAGGGLLEISWTDNSGIAMANPGDKCIIVVYCEELKQFVYSTGGAARSTGSDSINAGNFSGKEVHTWVSFISSDKEEVATSIYTGQVTVL